MPTILGNDRAESLLLDIRAGRAAAGHGTGDRAGAFLVSPTSVVIGRRNDAQLVYPLAIDVEPGALVTTSGTAAVSGEISGITVTGRFHWTLDDSGAAAPVVPAPPECYQFRRRGHDLAPPVWAAQLPRSVALPREGPVALRCRRATLIRRARDAERTLLSLTDQVLRRACRGPIHHALEYRTTVDADDAVQRSLQTVVRLLPLYASRDRPPCSWLGMLHLDGMRDMHREVSHLDWLPEEVATAVTFAHAHGVTRHAEPSVTLATLSATAERCGKAVPRIAATQLDAALVGLVVLARETTTIRTVAGPDAPEGERRRVVATVARLVTDDAETIARAAAGDPCALQRVGEQVVCRLARDHESPPVTRRRCWEQFQRSGQLFASAAGRDRFAAFADLPSLVAMDECLRVAAGTARRSD